MIGFNFHKKNIVLILKVAALGGAERQALGLAKYLIKHYNCNVSLVLLYNLEPTSEFKSFAAECGISKFHYFGKPVLSFKKKISLYGIKRSFETLHYLLKMYVGLSKLTPDVLIPFMNEPSKVAGLMYKRVGAQLTFWHQLGLDSHSFDKLERKAINSMPFIIANAENGLSVFRDKFKVPENKLFVLPQYVSINKKELDVDTIKEKLGIDNKSIVIGMIAHYREEKYHELLIEAFKEVKSDAKIHLVLVGNKDNDENTLLKYNRLLTKVSEMKIESEVSVLSGYSIDEVLNIIDVGVLVSKTEGTPNVVMEYMTYGIPVIASNHPGCIGLIGKTEFAINNDKSILKSKIELLVNNEKLRQEVGTKNELRIKDFSIENYFQKLTNIIQTIGL